MLVTKTDMGVSCERKKMTAPVIITLAKPSASGSAAAASEPNTASRITSTIGKPIFSALSRSSFVRSCMPAQSACWPTRCGSTPPRTSVPSSSWKSTAMSAVWFWSPSTSSGTTVIEADSAPRFAAAAARSLSATWGSSSAMRPTRSTSAPTVAASAPGLRASTTARCSRWAPSKRSMFVFHDLRLRARHLEAAAREVLGLAGGEREGGEDQQHPDREDEPPAPLEKSRRACPSRTACADSFTRVRRAARL